MTALDQTVHTCIALHIRTWPLVSFIERELYANEQQLGSKLDLLTYRKHRVCSLQ